MIYQFKQTNIKKMKMIYSTFNTTGIELQVKKLIRKIRNKLTINTLTYQKYSKQLKIMKMMYKLMKDSIMI